MRLLLLLLVTKYLIHTVTNGLSDILSKRIKLLKVVSNVEILWIRNQSPQISLVDVSNSDNNDFDTSWSILPGNRIVISASPVTSISDENNLFVRICSHPCWCLKELWQCYLQTPGNRCSTPSKRKSVNSSCKGSVGVMRVKFDPCVGIAVEKHDPCTSSGWWDIDDPS